MELQQRIDADIKAAMLARDKDRLNVLRAIKSALLLELTKEGGSHEVSQEAAQRILQKLHKQRAEAAEIYHQQGREDLATEEEAQARILEGYLPERMDEAALEALVKETLKAMGATSMKDMGRAMKEVNEKVAGRAEGAAVAAMVKRLLGAG
ncbi:MAG TPA: GatB/YqeY domain-containing protein [Flavobacteriales bacterium]|nr:GatB/YqeY domain-containing protein [Flavobacteriales bacterium]